MVYEIVYTPYAERDIWEIADYLSEHSITAAQKFLYNLRGKIESLNEMPLRFPKVISHQDYRKMTADKYVVIYLVDEHKKQIIIVRVVHGRRNYQDNAGGLTVK